MFLTIKKLHMWLGLILGIILIAESVTGLILAEPWLVGQSHDKSQPRMQQRQSTEIKGLSNEVKEQRLRALGIVKGLHQGRYSDINFKWLIDISAIGIIVLTISGLYLSIPYLKRK